MPIYFVLFITGVLLSPMVLAQPNLPERGALL
jgi:hypothetical protein